MKYHRSAGSRLKSPCPIWGQLYLPLACLSTWLLYLSRAANTSLKLRKSHHSNMHVMCKRDELLPVLAMAWESTCLCYHGATLVATNILKSVCKQASVWNEG